MNRHFSWLARWIALIAAIVLLLGLLVASPAGAQLDVVSWIQFGSNVDGEASNDLSGGALAISTDGTTLVVGAARNDGGGLNSGHVRVLRWDSGSWNRLGADINGENARDQSGTAVAIAADGGTIAIGAPMNDGNGSNAGHVRIYRWNGSAWARLGSDIDGEAANDHFGTSVALSGNGESVIVGAPNNAGNGDFAGHARVYHFSDGDWAQIGIDLDGEDAFDKSGGAVAIAASGDIVAVGARQNEGASGGSGHVRVFGLNGSEWVQVGADIDGVGFVERLGFALDMSDNGNTLVVGMPGYETNTTFRGGARVFRWDGSTWGQLGEVIEGERVFDLAGKGVAISSDGNRVIVGAGDNEDKGRFFGHARIFEWDGAAWTQLGEDIDGEVTNDFAGDAVAMSGDGTLVAVGAQFNDGTGANAGHVRVFRETRMPTGPLFCNGLVVTVDLALGQSPTANNDVIRGTTGPDLINGLGGNDTICGLQGGDTIDGGDGFDTVFGGSGDDTIVGGAGNDILIGGLGADEISGGRGNDRIQGGDSADMLDGGGGYDRVSGGNGDDIIRGGSHDDLLFGNLGRDEIFGDGGDDTIRGGAWLDTMNGGSGNDGCTLTDPTGSIEVRISCEAGVFGR